MFTIPIDILPRYVALLTRNGIVASGVAEYKKWLRYYLDFCDKYPVPEAHSERVRLFCEKLRQKNQSEQQRQQAAQAVSLYFEVQRLSGTTEKPCSSLEAEARKVEVLGTESIICEPTALWSPPGAPRSPQAQSTRVSRGSSHYNAAGYEEKSDSPEWDALLSTLAAEIKVRHYSRKTLKTYANWSRQFQRFLKNKPPHELSTADVKDYLTYLAVKRNVAASTQNQAFNSLLFLFR